MYDGIRDYNFLKVKGIPSENWGLFSHPAHMQKILILYNDAPGKSLEYTVELPQKMKVAPAMEEIPVNITGQFTVKVKSGDYMAYLLTPL